MIAASPAAVAGAAVPAALLAGPYPTEAANRSRFAAADPANDLFVRLLGSPDTSYPIFVITRGGTGPDAPGVSFADAAPLHPALALLARADGWSECGWWTPNLSQICAAVGLDANALAPNFPAATCAAGRAIIRALNAAFETAVAERRSVLRAGEAQLFVAAIVSALQTGRTADLVDLKDSLDRIDSHDYPLVRYVAQILVAHGLWTHDQLRALPR